MTSVRVRLMRLESKRRFLNWFVTDRFYESLTADELLAFGRDGKLPDPIPNRPSRIDLLDRKSLLKRWEEQEQVFGDRSEEELKYYCKSGFWPEKRGRFHYWMQDGWVKLRVEPEEEGIVPGRQA